MTRISLLSENDLATTVASLRTQMDTLKNSQIISGSAVRYSYVTSSNTSDFHMTSVGTTAVGCQLTFTPTDPTILNTACVFNFLMSVTVTSGYSYNSFVEQLVPANNQQIFMIYIASQSGTIPGVDLKYAFLAQAPGTFTTVLV